MPIGPEWRAAYEASFIRDVHSLLAQGYTAALERIVSADRDADREEDAITGFIVEGMRDELVSNDRFTRYDVHEQRPLPSAARTGTRRRRIDILVESRATQPLCEFVFEAKRLRANGFPISQYTGSNGMGCFVLGEYASSCPAACMLGYVQSHDPQRWFRELERSLALRQQSLRPRGPLTPAPVDPRLPHEWVSEHDRGGPDAIRLYHVFLDCCPSEAN